VWHPESWNHPLPKHTTPPFSLWGCAMSEDIDSRPLEPITPGPTETMAPELDLDLPTAAYDQAHHDVAAWGIYDIISRFPDDEARMLLDLASTRLTLNRMIQQREKERPKHVAK
jgi:hypothetical protein